MQLSNNFATIFEEQLEESGANQLQAEHQVSQDFEVDTPIAPRSLDFDVSD